jgi:hypothetical protein
MLRKRIKSGLAVLGLGTMLVLGAGSWGMAAPQAPVQTYSGQVESIKIDHCDQQPGTCAGSLVLAQANDQQVDLVIPAGTVIQRGGERACTSRSSALGTTSWCRRHPRTATCKGTAGIGHGAKSTRMSGARSIAAAKGTGTKIVPLSE